MLWRVVHEQVDVVYRTVPLDQLRLEVSTHFVEDGFESMESVGVKDLRKVFHQRSDSQHQWSREIVNNYGMIIVEDLNAKGLSRGLLSKSVHDAGWAAFFSKLSYKGRKRRTMVLRCRCPWN
jgi:IS605 OrfB family transposase